MSNYRKLQQNTAMCFAALSVQARLSQYMIKLIPAEKEGARLLAQDAAEDFRASMAAFVPEYLAVEAAKNDSQDFWHLKDDLRTLCMRVDNKLSKHVDAGDATIDTRRAVLEKIAPYLKLRNNRNYLESLANALNGIGKPTGHRSGEGLPPPHRPFGPQDALELKEALSSLQGTLENHVKNLKGLHRDSDLDSAKFSDLNKPKDKPEDKLTYIKETLRGGNAWIAERATPQQLAALARAATRDPGRRRRVQDFLGNQDASAGLRRGREANDRDDLTDRTLTTVTTRHVRRRLREAATEVRPGPPPQTGRLLDRRATVREDTPPPADENGINMPDARQSPLSGPHRKPLGELTPDTLKIKLDERSRDRSTDHGRG